MIIEPCRKGEKVCILLPDGVPSHIFYMYSHVLEELDVKIPFKNFECEIYIETSERRLYSDTSK